MLIDINFTLVCKEYKHLKGTSKKTGNPFNFYNIEFRDPLSDKTYFMNVNALDEKNPPVIDCEYPVKVNIGSDYSHMITSNLIIDRSLIS